ncbi:MAG TPA: cobalamin B12-binding domain-containing protein [Thermoanaerobaculaceae bacterium]|nr:cobalamin B12-binding domain-containing protein [Thermoanaerobaculaceae bacterium]
MKVTRGRGPTARAAAGRGPLWCMAAVTTRTGIGQHTLRAWERRFGFPAPLRLPSGHRRYTDEQITRLHLIGQAIALGHRAGDVVPLREDKLKELLRQSYLHNGAMPPWEVRLLEKLQAFDREGIVSDLAHAYAGLGVRTFLRDRLVPLATAVGDAWAAGGLAIRHVHFLTEILDDTLRTLRTPLEHGGEGRPVVFATLPGERHTLGVQVAALVTALAGRRLRILGAELPPDEIAGAAEQLDPLAVGVSVTPHTALAGTARSLNQLRYRLGDRTAVWVGGSGAALLSGLDPAILHIDGIDGLEVELRRAETRDTVHPQP